MDASSPLSDDADSGACVSRVFDEPKCRRAQIAHVTAASVKSDMLRAPGQYHRHNVEERLVELSWWILEPLRFKVTYLCSAVKDAPDDSVVVASGGRGENASRSIGPFRKETELNCAKAVARSQPSR